MGLTTTITRSLDNNYVQVDATSNKNSTRSFRVPASKADSFMSNYKKQDRRMTFLTNTAFGAFILAGVLITNVFAKKIKNNFAKYILNTAGGIAAGTGSIYASSKFIKYQKNNLLKKHGANEIITNN